MTSTPSTASSRRVVLRLASLATALGAVSTAVLVAVAAADRPPDDWPRKAEFCEAAAALEVGSVGLSRAEHLAALERLGDSAPEQLAEAFDEVIHANTHGDRSMVNQDRMREVGEFIEETCQVNVAGVAS